MNNNLEIAEYTLLEAKKLGAVDAEAIIVEAADRSFRTRLGKFESVESSQSRDLGIRVFIADKKGHKTAIISTNNLTKNNITETVGKAIDLAKLAPTDEHARLANEGEYAKSQPDLMLFDDSAVSNEELTNWASEAENSALEVKGITNSEGADASHSTSETVLLTSKGFSGVYKNSGFSVSVSIIAGDENGMETEYEYSYVRHKKDLEKPQIIGKKAAELAIKKLNPRKIDSCKVPIIFDRRVSKSIVSAVCSAINGNSIVKKSSFLCDSLNQQILPKGIDIVDDPTILKGLSSEPFDAEGLESKKMFLVKDGILQNWILDLRSADKLGLKSNGRASRGISSIPSPSSTNVYMNNGAVSELDLIKNVKNGLYLMDVFGMGINSVTGDYSQGANGFWIENGEIKFPVSEITIAGNLKDMFMNLTAANNLEMHYSKNAPTLMIEGMTIAGS
jgi:PmbA protein